MSDSFAFEQVAARLVPFDFSASVQTRVNDTMSFDAVNDRSEFDRLIQDNNNTYLGARGSELLVQVRGVRNEMQPASVPPSDPLAPLYRTGGLVFPYMPAIAEGISVRYEPIDVIHSNEAYNAYRNTDNVRIEINNAIFTCDTFENARYTLAALHFFRTYSLMDFGTGQGQTGKPPSPMWFSAYGSYAFKKKPVLLERASWTFPNDVDYVGVPEPGTDAWNNNTLSTNRHAPDAGRYTWLPIKFEISSISLIVQHAPRYWLNFSLADYRSGAMLTKRGSFDTAAAAQGGSNTAGIQSLARLF